MDHITQLQMYVTHMPNMMVNSIDGQSNTSLSVAQAHELAQLAETGYIGLEGVTGDVPPVPLKRLEKFRAGAMEALSLAQYTLHSFQDFDTIISALPETLPSEEEQDQEIKQLSSEYEEASLRLLRAEQELLYYQQCLQQKQKEKSGVKNTGDKDLVSAANLLNKS